MSKNKLSHNSQIHNPVKLKSERAIFKQWYQANDDVLSYLTALLSDFRNMLPSYRQADYRKDVDVLTSRYHAEGMTFATSVLPQLSQGLFLYLETGRSSYPGFKRCPGCEYPAFLRGLFATIYDTQSNEDERSTAINFVYQLSVAFKKLKGPFKSSKLRHQLADFVEVDRELFRLDLRNPEIQPVLRHARSIVKHALEDLSIDDLLFMPRPGPGATNTPVEKHMRFEPHVLYAQIDEVMPYDIWFYANYSHLFDRQKKFLHLHNNAKKEHPTSRFKYVHKYVGKARGICIEENETQWLQQALKNALYSHLEHHKMTKGRVNFQKQCVNRKLALTGSLTRDVATIDMKDASDRVSRDLVSYLFQDNEELHDCLMALSTREIRLPDLGKGPSTLWAYKYAPMGSGLCFPVMALTHFALCKAIIKVHYSKELSRQVFVYGDDIIVPSTCAQSIYDWLPKFGMKINENKSFVKSYFRESCGLHAYNGVEITPVYLKCIPNKHSRTPDLLGCISVEYQLFTKGLYSTAELLRRSIMRIWGELPYVGESSPVLGFKRAGRSHLAHVKHYAKRVRRKNELCIDTQQSEYRLRVVVDETTPARTLPDWEGYLRKLVTDTFDSASVRGSLVIQRITTEWILESAI